MALNGKIFEEELQEDALKNEAKSISRTIKAIEREMLWWVNQAWRMIALCVNAIEFINTKCGIQHNGIDISSILVF